MVVIKLAEPLRLSDELWAHLVNRGVASADMSDNANLACYIQECLARDDGRVPVALQKDVFAASVCANRSVATNGVETEVSVVDAADTAEVQPTIEQDTQETTQQVIESSSPSTTQIMSRLNTLYNSGGSK